MSFSDNHFIWRWASGIVNSNLSFFFWRIFLFLYTRYNGCKNSLRQYDLKLISLPKVKNNFFIWPSWDLSLSRSLSSPYKLTKLWLRWIIATHINNQSGKLLPGYGVELCSLSHCVETRTPEHFFTISLHLLGDTVAVTVQLLAVPLMRRPEFLTDVCGISISKRKKFHFRHTGNLEQESLDKFPVQDRMS